jgi:hypothetical protein
MRATVAGLVSGVLASLVWAAPAAARIDPCLLTPEGIEDVVGVAVVRELRGVAECSFVSEAGPENGVSVAITLLEAESKKDAKQVFKEQRVFAPDRERVRGVADAAFYTASIGDVVVFRKGATVVTVTLLVFGDELDPHRDDAVALAEMAADAI